MLPPISTLLCGISDQQIYTLPITPVLSKQVTTSRQIMVPKRKFTAEDDALLRSLVARFGTNWEVISSYMPDRSVRQCRDRWNNYINPNLSTRPFSPDEDELLIALYRKLGSKWSRISKHFDRRSDNSIRNRWNYLLRQSEKIHSSSNGSSDEL